MSLLLCRRHRNQNRRLTKAFPLLQQLQNWLWAENREPRPPVVKLGPVEHIWNQWACFNYVDQKICCLKFCEAKTIGAWPTDGRLLCRGRGNILVLIYVNCVMRRLQRGNARTRAHSEACVTWTTAAAFDKRFHLCHKKFQLEWNKLCYYQ